MGVDFAGSGSLANHGTITGASYGFAQDGVILGLAAHLTNFGTIDGGSGDVGGGTGVTTSSGLINYGLIQGGRSGGGGGPGTYGNGVVGSGIFVNYGSIAGGYNGGTNQAGSGIILEGSSNLSNSGIITGGSGYYSGGYGVNLESSGEIANSGTIIGGRGYGALRVSGGGAGVMTETGLNNSGTIIGGSGYQKGGNGVQGSEEFLNTGSIIGGSGYQTAGGVGVLLDQNANLVNRGYIEGGNAGAYFTVGYADGNGVDLNGGELINSGVIKGGGLQARIGGAGVDMNGGLLVNSGRITGAFGSYAEGTGVILNGGTIIDRGVIAGFSYYGPPGPAVMFGSVAGTLVVEPGAVFQGKVIADAAAHDVLAAYGTSATPLSGIGTEFLNFSTIAIDRHALGTIEGNVAGIAAGQAITGFHQGDTLVLDGFKAVSGTYAAGHGVELYNGRTTVTLDITGSFNPAELQGSASGVGTTISLADTAQITLGTNRSTFTFVAAGRYSAPEQSPVSPWLHPAGLAPSLSAQAAPAFNTEPVNTGIARVELLVGGLSGTQEPWLLHNQNTWLHQG